MNYIKTYWRYYGLLFVIVLFFQLYYVFLSGGRRELLWYFDVLIGVGIALFMIVDYLRFTNKQKHIKDLVESDYIITPELTDCENIIIAQHDVELLTHELNQQIDINLDLQDYIMKWCHEVKLPLSAALLMNEQMQDKELQKRQREQLEKISQQLNMALVGCRVQSKLYDLQIKPCSLLECVRTSIKNNQYFLITHHFTMEIEVEDTIVYSDMQWLVYVLDQLLSNAIKYHQERPILKLWSETTSEAVKLYVEDHGEGILEQDIRRIFEKGYTGNNHHNGQYRSTGMGLYMAVTIIKKLSHTIEVESEVGVFTRFILTFQDNRDFFHR